MVSSHLRSVGERGQLRDAASGTVAVVDRHLGDAPALVDGMDRKFRLYLESGREHGHGLGEHGVEGAVAGHDVLELEAVDPLDEPTHEIVPETMEGAVVLFAVRAV